MTRAGAPADVLLTGADTRSGLAIARSLAAHGISCAALGADPRSPTFRSRHVRNALVGPAPAREPEAHAEFVLAAARRLRSRLVVPVNDEALFALDRQRAIFSDGPTLALPSSDAVANVLDKRRNLAIAERLGIPCPRRFEATGPEQADEVVEALGLPVVLKNPAHKLPLDGPPLPFRVLYARSADEVRALLREHCADGRMPIFQEQAVGRVHNLCCFAAGGDTVALLEYLSRRRTVGSGVLREIVPARPDLAAFTRSMLKELRWEGVAQVSFFVDDASDRVFYMETNGRFWASVQGSVNAGWDFPHWVVDYFGSGRRPEPGPLAIGSLTCWHAGDLRALLSYLGGGPSPSTGAEVGRGRAVLQYLSGFGPGIHSDVFRWSDPLPALVEHGQIVGELAARAMERLRKS